MWHWGSVQWAFARLTLPFCDCESSRNYGIVFPMKTEKQREGVTVQLLNMYDPEAQFDPPVPGTPGERMGMVWPLTVEAISIGGKLDAEQRLQRHVVRFVRSES